MNTDAVFWSVASFLLVWALAYAGLVIFTFWLATPEHWQGLVAEGRITQGYADYIARIPHWAIVFTFVAAAARLSGAVALTLGSTLAVPLFAVSLALVAILMFRGFVLADVAQVIRGSQVLLEIVFLALSVFALWFAWRRLG